MAQKQLLHLVLGGELSNIEDVEFKDLDQVDIVGLYPNYASAYAAWKGKAQRTVDNAQMRYFIVHLHRLLDPATDATRQQHLVVSTCPCLGRAPGANARAGMTRVGGGIFDKHGRTIINPPRTVALMALGNSSAARH